MSQKTPIEVAKKWLEASAKTATEKDFKAHFNLVSRKVRITGMPGFESISYDDWARASEQEFKDDVLKSVSYEGLKLQATNDHQIMFKTVEKVIATNGTQKIHGVEILLEIESDGVWRVIQERVLTDDESRHDGLI